MIKVNLTGAQNAAKEDLKKASEALKLLKSGRGKGNDFIGWTTLPDDYDKAEFARIKAAAETIRKNAEAFVVIGIGGSYLGARAAIELLKSPRHNEKNDGPAIYFIGNGLSGEDLAEVLELVKGKSLYLNVISKSGTTLEPALAFRIFRKYMNDTYGDDAKNRIFATTDKSRGVLKELADKAGYECFVVPDNIGGRYSVLTAVGLLPMAAAGIDIDKVMAEAKRSMDAYLTDSEDNQALRYAAMRQALYAEGKKLEVLSYPGESMRFMAEWWKQLYGESEGKQHSGIFPASCQLTADLHSLGQYIQDGERMLFESIIRFGHSNIIVDIPFIDGDEDKLNYVCGKDYNDIFAAAAEGVRQAHISGGVPCLELVEEANGEEAFADMVIFFEVACAVSGYMQGVNPFDQPGVEEYKKNMFALLGRK